MRPTPRHKAAERDFRGLLAKGGLAPPDDAEYFPASILFRWHGPKLAVFLDLDDPRDLVASGAEIGTRAALGPPDGVGPLGAVGQPDRDLSPAERAPSAPGSARGRRRGSAPMAPRSR